MNNEKPWHRRFSKETEMVTPERALRFLEKNKNRKLRKTHVESLAKLMTTGQWIPEICSPIMFDEEGHLRHGQHRMSALVMAGMQFEFEVWRNTPSHILEQVDVFIQPRSLSDQLQFQEDGWRNQKIVQVINALSNIRAGKIYKLSVADCRKVYESASDALQWYAAHAKNDARIGQSAVGAAMVEMYLRDKSAAMRFIESLQAPAGTCQQAVMLRDFLLRSPSFLGGTGRARLYRYCVGAMSYALKGREVKVIREGDWD